MNIQEIDWNAYGLDAQDMQVLKDFVEHVVSHCPYSNPLDGCCVYEGNATPECTPWACPFVES